MWLLFSAIFIMLLGISIQDFKSRSVYIFWFPALIILFFIGHLLNHHAFKQVGQSIVINLVFLTLQFLIISIYFSIKQRSWVNITCKLLGWGDILFLVSIAFYLSVLNFLLFYILSLLLTLLTWFLWLKISNTKDKRVPLAGFQAAILVLYFTGDLISKTIDTTSDSWLLGYFII